MKNIRLYLLLVSFLPIPLLAQQIQNVRFEQEGKQVHIYYDIVGAKSSDRYEVKVFCSITGKNDFSDIPLRKVNGDVGERIKSGYGKKITWDVLSEVDKLQNSQVAFKVTAEKPEDLPWLEMVYVEGGIFNMGSNEGDDDEKPIHEVQVEDFYIGKYEVTQAQWRRVMGSDSPKLKFKGCDLCPVERVSWNDIQEFLKKLNVQTGQNYRLPTEAEWEYAASGGNKSKGYKYAGSNDIDSVAWYLGNSSSEAQPVGQKAPNELGLFDMSGNVWEWCADRYGYYYISSPKNNPQESSSSYRDSKVIRGGSWYNYTNLLVTNRNNKNPYKRSSSIGFRVVRD